MSYTKILNLDLKADKQIEDPYNKLRWVDISHQPVLSFNSTIITYPQGQGLQSGDFDFIAT